MIRRYAILVLIAGLALFSLWRFYADALRYDPRGEGLVKHSQVKNAPAEGRTSAPAWSSDIHEKNLFSPSRTYKEPKPLVVTAPIEPPKRPDLVLKGIVFDTYGDYVAYVEIDQAKATPLRKGDKVQEIEVVDITEKKVVLQWNGETITMTIEKVKTLSNNPRSGR